MCLDMNSPSRYILACLAGKKPAQAWGLSSAGRAPEWHSGGQRFDPARLHDTESLIFGKLIVGPLAREVESSGSFCAVTS